MLLRIAPIIMIAILIGPVLAGLFHIIVPAFGHDPILGKHGFSLNAFVQLKQIPNILHSIWLSYWVGLAATFFSLLFVVLFVASFKDSRWFLAIKILLKPVVAMPHAAAAFGLAFLIMPSGFILRLVSPQLNGFDRPPDWLIVNDVAGFSLLFALMFKEIAFLLLVILAVLPLVETRYAKVGQVFGHKKIYSWLFLVFPLIYKQMRLPVYAVIAFATSVVDVAIILGPGNSPTLSVQILRLMSDPDLSQRSVVAAAAIVQFLITIFALFTWWLGEKLVGFFGKKIALSGTRIKNDLPLKILGFVGVNFSIFFTLLGLVLLAIWSVAGLWSFPDILPKSLNFSSWIREFSNLFLVSKTAILIAFSASLIAIILVLASLENEYQNQIKLSKGAKFMLYIPLLVPQISFLFGLSIWFLWVGIDGNFFAVTFVHLIFVLPYVYLLLGDSFKNFDVRYLNIARLMGRSQLNVFFTIRVPLLLRPILMALALGFAISIAQYLPTLLIGAGRVPTITTEAVALASGGNRRLIGVYALIQTLLPFLVFAIASFISFYIWRNKRGLN